MKSISAMPAAKSQKAEFLSAIKSHQSAFSVSLTPSHLESLIIYHELLLRWNDSLHLVGPCSPAEFAVRHILESLVATKFIAEGAHVVDVGSGGGLPILPCLIARADITTTLIESSQRKSVFLREVIRELGCHNRAVVVAKRFETITAPRAEAVTCRAIERFEKVLPALIDWSPPEATLLLFGGERIRHALDRANARYKEVRLPESKQRFLLALDRVAQTIPDPA